MSGDLGIVRIRAERLELQVERVRYVAARPVGMPGFVVQPSRVREQSRARRKQCR